MYIPFQDCAKSSENLEGFLKNVKQQFEKIFEIYERTATHGKSNPDMSTAKFSFEVSNNGYVNVCLQDDQDF